MNITVSISEFRDNISDYLNKVSRGVTIVIKDEKKGQEIAKVTATQKWDPVAYRLMLKRMAENPISAKDHPEWATRKKVEKWLRQTRKNFDRDLGI